MMKFAEEFKTFALKGNPVEMAVGVLLGLSFNKVVNTLVNEILMPPLGFLINDVAFKDLRWVLRPEQPGADGMVLPAVSIGYGMFINTVVEFFIVAFTLFVVVKVMNRLIRRREAETAS